MAQHHWIYLALIIVASVTWAVFWLWPDKPEDERDRFMEGIDAPPTSPPPEGRDFDFRDRY